MNKTPMADRRTNSTSLSEAQASVNQLTGLVAQILGSNQDMSQRLAKMESRALAEQTSVIGAEDNASMTHAADESKDDESVVTAIRLDTTKDSEPLPSYEESKTRFAFAFDQDLSASRPYARLTRRLSIGSLNSSAVQSLGWSYLSGISLADISEISIVGLPIAPDELWNGQHYTTNPAPIPGLMQFMAQSEAENKTRAFHSNLLHKRAVSTEFGPSYFARRKERVPPQQEKILPSRARRYLKSGLSSSSRRMRFGPVSPGIAAAAEPGLKRVVLFGITNSGKSTIYKHLQMLQGAGYDRQEGREDLINGLTSMILAAKERLNTIQSSEISMETISQLNGYFDRLESAKELGFPKEDSPMGPFKRWGYEELSLLCSVPRLREMIRTDAHNPLNENFDYLFDHIDDVLLSRYNDIPDEYKLRLSHRTTGIDKRPMDVDGISWEIVDTAGSRVERRKWAQHCGPNANTIFFVVSLNGYHQCLYEDQSAVRGPLFFFDLSAGLTTI